MGFYAYYFEIVIAAIIISFILNVETALAWRALPVYFRYTPRAFRIKASSFFKNVK